MKTCWFSNEFEYEEDKKERDKKRNEINDFWTTSVKEEVETK